MFFNYIILLFRAIHRISIRFRRCFLKWPSASLRRLRDRANIPWIIGGAATRPLHLASIHHHRADYRPKLWPPLICDSRLCIARASRDSREWTADGLFLPICNLFCHESWTARSWETRRKTDCFRNKACILPVFGLRRRTKARASKTETLYASALLAARWIESEIADCRVREVKK